MISIRGLHKFFNKGRQNEIHVINDVTLDLPSKGMVAVFGKSGCGKTTLLNVIGGLDKFAEGTLTVDGQSIKDNTDVIRNKYIGYIFQNYNLNKDATCFDNVADALRLCGMSDAEEIEERVGAALANVGMQRYSKRTPDTLSGGQQQRIAVARAIVKNPKIILADEPTGNLDEANTVMIMDLLKAISKDHLVILVTHEANLVDYYCDTVIELHDGKIADIKQNTDANGFLSRDKNDIWLGELDKRSISDEHAEIEYYGDKPAAPIKMKIVNSGGKIYLEIGTEKVQIVDEYSEVKLRDGVYEERVNQNAVSESIDMSKLPPVSGTRFGSLFSFKSSLKSGYISNFRKRKKSKTVLLGCMCLFAAVVVFMSAVFGSAFGDIIDARAAYNHNVFYLYTPDASVSAKLNGAIGKDNTGIDYLRLDADMPRGDAWAFFRAGSFETFEQLDWESNFKTNAVYLDVSLTENMKLVEGKKDNLAVEEILISTRVADALLEKSTLGYITERGDLIGLLSTMFTVDGKSPRIVGIVESDEPAVYLSELGMAKYVHSKAFTSYTMLASDHGIEVAPGEAVLAVRDQSVDIQPPRIGETIKIQGRDIKVVGIKQAYYDYHTWLKNNGIEKADELAFFTAAVKRENPTLAEDSPEFILALEKARVEGYYEYLDYFYSDMDAFLRDLYFFESSDMYLWLYVEKGVDAAKYIYIPEDYYKAKAYKELYGAYPTAQQLEKHYESLPYPYEELEHAMMLYENEFYSNNNYSYFSTNTYLVNEKDYIAFSKQLGETHPSAAKMDEGVMYNEAEGAKDKALDVEGDIIVDTEYYGGVYYTVIHSSDPERTAAWLESEFSDLRAPNSYWPKLLTPDGVFDGIIRDKTQDIVTGIVTLAVILVLMSVCMYFIMRSSLMNRIKEVGIYRAIGVSKKNLVFKFFVEAVLLTTLTVFVGYLLTSTFLFACLGMSALVEEIFYYPMWLAGAVLLILYLISLFFGTLPIISLLQKTPSEILSKYDI